MKKEIIIIGAGIVGSTTAFYLSQQSDYKITLIDSGVGNASRAAAGIICPWLSQRRNKDWYALTSQGAQFYPHLMQELTQAGITNLPYQQTGTLVFKKKPELVDKLYQLAKERQIKAPMIGELHIFQSPMLRQLIPQLETEHGAVLASGGGRLDGAGLLDCLQELFLKNGGQFIKGQAHLVSPHTVQINNQELRGDQLILTNGAWLPQLLTPLGYQVDVRPQKGQLLEIQTDFPSDQWPGCMLHGEIDILPFEDGKLVIGASHEDQMGYDLTVDDQMIADMKETATDFLPKLNDFNVSATRVGTRAYTSDFLPFYGNLPDNPHLWVASGLGSSGLTSGPFIGWQIAQEILGQKRLFDRSPFSPERYIQKVPQLNQNKK